MKDQRFVDRSAKPVLHWRCQSVLHTLRDTVLYVWCKYSWLCPSLWTACVFLHVCFTDGQCLKKACILYFSPSQWSRFFLVVLFSGTQFSFHLIQSLWTALELGQSPVELLKLTAGWSLCEHDACVADCDLSRPDINLAQCFVSAVPVLKHCLGSR